VTYELNNEDEIGFVSLSDIYSLSDHKDSLATPDLSEISDEVAKQFEYIKLNQKYRHQFLTRTKISETDKVFIYSYEKNKLISFPVNNLNVVACLNFYGAEWPYSQFDFMIGFEIDKKYLNGFEDWFNHTLVYVGQESPFILYQMKPILWKEIKTEEFPEIQISPEDTAQFHSYLHSTYLQIGPDDTIRLNKYKCVEGNVYCYETNGMQYFVKEYFSGEHIFMRRLLVIDLKTKEIILQKIFYSHESAEPSPLNFVEGKDLEQWTGKLFKNSPTVILGFEYVSFGCQRIIFLSSKDKEIYINCDNRH
jgi:hypothetical protein